METFFSLTSLLKILAAIEKEKVKLALQSKEILEIWNVPTKI